MQGGLPYVDLADLKGPLVFLFHGIAALLTPGSFLGACLLHAPLVGLENSLSLCPTSFHIPRPNLPVTPGVS